MQLNEIVTKHDLEKLKHELISEIKNLALNSKPFEKLLKSKDVKRMLGCSDSTLQCLRQSGKLSFDKVGGTYYYTQQGINQLLKTSALN